MGIDLSFLWCLGICLLIIGVLGIYFKNKLTEQEHKITAMFGIVTTMANQLNSLRKPPPAAVAEQCPIFMNPTNSSSNLIHVSDDEEDGENELDNCDDDNCSTSSSESSSSSSSSSSSESSIEELNDLNVDDIKTINIDNSLDNDLEEFKEFKVFKEKPEDNMDKDEDSETDYKKMTLAKLRKFIVEKGIVEDASKLSKKEILKLLS
jgi:hypothetical protein